MQYGLAIWTQARQWGNNYCNALCLPDAACLCPHAPSTPDVELQRSLYLNHIQPKIPHFTVDVDKYLLLTKFKVCTVSYRPSFSRWFMRMWDIIQWERKRIWNLQYRPR